MCVCMVIDAVKSNNLHVERGVTLRINTPAAKANSSSNHGNDTPPEEKPNQDVGNSRVRWPAVYMRSTVHLSSTLLSSQRSTVSSHSGSSTRLSGGSQSNLLGWGKGSTNQINTHSSHNNSTSGGGASPLLSGARKAALVPNILEYGPDTGTAKTWPHNEWDHLVGLIDPQSVSTRLVYQPTRDDLDEQAAISYREKGEDPITFDARASIEEAASLFSSAEVSTPTNISVGKDKKPASVFHVAPLGDALYIAVVVKGEVARWNRRRSSLSDEEVRMFLTKM